MTIENTILNSTNNINYSDIEQTTNTAVNSQVSTESGNELPSLFSTLLEDMYAESSSDPESGNLSAGAELVTDSLTNLFNDENLGKMQQTLLNALQRSVLDGLSSDSQVESTSTSTNQSEVVSSDDTESTDSMGLFMSSMSTVVFGEDGLDLQDGFDAVNLLNHVPIVSDIYAETNSTDLSSAASLAGSFIYGGTSGVIYRAADMAVDKITGSSISSNLWSLGEQVFNGLTDYSGDSKSTINTIAKSAFVN